MRKKKAAIPKRHLVVDSSTGEVVGALRLKKKRPPVLAFVAGLLCCAVLVCGALLIHQHRESQRLQREAEERETERQEVIRNADDFLEARKKAWEGAKEGVDYYVDSNGHWVYIPEVERGAGK
jgi:hypothetical protein